MTAERDGKPDTPRGLSRRSFLAGAAGVAGVSAAGAVVGRPRRAAASTRPTAQAPVLIIGSGYAGAVAALRLSQAGVPKMPDSVYNSADYLAARTWFAQATAAGLNPTRCDMAVDWQRILDEEAGTATPSAILGYSIWGVNSGAKRSVDQTILAAAEA